MGWWDPVQEIYPASLVAEHKCLWVPEKFNVWYQGYLSDIKQDAKWKHKNCLFSLKYFVNSCSFTKAQVNDWEYL